MKINYRGVLFKKQYIPPSIYVEEIDVGDMIAATGADVNGSDMGGEGSNGGPSGPPRDDDEEVEASKKYWGATYFEDFESDF